MKLEEPLESSPSGPCHLAQRSRLVPPPFRSVCYEPDFPVSLAMIASCVRLCSTPGAPG